ncbi:semaphorin-4C-like [Polyodon spathula]|uniref:semaphorin-4C-like n=1 Tax=Polyodon spathula TaxID=7913 RepID=UPI001B7F6904|nr:semaphorin-4C-like [Polyodon spathula]XP_041089483.1 semaphorin-4C-like [Polyodon spathula]XP_041089484.1 semaphorin-4C-like [Polyodon spathula]XP_041089486.1 semaphorin-4C-like [Polyodon spathula]XP_041089487.1 semaphorin-4C-like [Polyodon spathula]
MGGVCVPLGVALLLGALTGGSWGLDWDPVPRKTVLRNSLKGVRRFSSPSVFNYTTLTLDEVSGFLYVGAREAAFALDMNNVELERKPSIMWGAPTDKKTECVLKGKNNQTECFNHIRFLQNFNRTHMYCCGTYAFQPKCAYIDTSRFTLELSSMEDGKGKCPYDPAKGHTGLIVDGELYSATLNNFLGTEPVVLRNVGGHYSMKTEYLPSWLNEPDFVGSSFVPESVDSPIGDDDKIYFFFSERAVELDCDSDLVVTRVARVCKGDVGGARTLQKKWTSFLKARVLCSLPERQVHFNRLQAVFTLRLAEGWQHSSFYTVFRAQWGDVDVSAVCQYHIDDIKKVFDGPYKEYREPAQKWGRYTNQVPVPRPGACITNWHRETGFNSSLQLPDNTLNFAKKHPLMDDKVSARPLLVKKSVNFTQIAVDRVSAIDHRRYDVLFIGTAEGWLYKAVSLGSEVHLIEELQLFEEPQPVESLAISHKEKLLYVGSRSEVLQLPLADCGKYRSSPDCTLSRDPYCAWDREGKSCVRTDKHPSHFSLDQDILQEGFKGQARAKFEQSPIPNSDKAKPKNVTVVLGSDLVLPCQQISNLAHPLWLFNDLQLVPGQGVRVESRLGSLVIEGAGAGEAGRYTCLSQERGERFLAERYAVSVVASAPVFMEARAPDGILGLVWVLVITLASACLLLLGSVLYLRRRLKQDKGSELMKPLESTLVYPISLPREPTHFVASKGSDSELWDNSSYYYSDGSLKIVPGHAPCPSTTPGSGIPGQPLPSTAAVNSPNRLSLGNIRGSGSNGYIRLNLSSGGEERAEFSAPFTEELRKTLKQRSVLPDTNPEESSV